MQEMKGKTMTRRGRPPKQELAATQQPTTLPNGYTVEENGGRFIIRQSGNVVHVEDSQDRVDQYLKMVTGNNNA